jgi:YD repeat-containing protein
MRGFHWFCRSIPPRRFVGRKKSYSDPALQSSVYFYDKNANLSNIVYTHNAAITNSFDALNRLTNRVDGLGSTVYAYDAAGQLLSEGGLWTDDTVSFTYNNRLRTGVSLRAPNSDPWVETYGYDGARRLRSLTAPAGTFSSAYDSVRHLQVGTLSLPNGAYITNTYDAVDRMVSTVLKNSANGVLNSHGYAYDLASRRTGLTNTFGDYRSYTYDNIGQLKTAFAKESGGTANRWNEQSGYAYDAAGNLNWRTNNALTQAFNVNNLNELTTATNTGSITVRERPQVPQPTSPSGAPA